MVIEEQNRRTIKDENKNNGFLSDETLERLALVLAHFAVFGIVHPKDEGAAAHTWQTLMGAQLPVVAYFMFNWLRKQVKESLLVLALLAGTWVANFTAVFFLT